MKTVFILLLTLFFTCACEKGIIDSRQIKSSADSIEEDKPKCQLITSPNRISCLTMNSTLNEIDYEFDEKIKFDDFNKKYVCCHVEFRIKANPYSICSYITRNEDGWNKLEDTLDDNGADDVKIWCNSSSLSIRLLYIAAFILVALI
jgi:hypothetical protein